MKLSEAMRRGIAVTKPVTGAFTDGGSPPTHACAIGAIFVGLELDVSGDGLRNLLPGYINTYSGPYGHIAEWNDRETLKGRDPRPAIADFVEWLEEGGAL